MLLRREVVQQRIRVRNISDRRGIGFTAGVHVHSQNIVLDLGIPRAWVLSRRQFPFGAAHCVFTFRGTDLLKNEVMTCSRGRRAAQSIQTSMACRKSCSSSALASRVVKQNRTTLRPPGGCTGVTLTCRMMYLGTWLRTLTVLVTIGHIVLESSTCPAPSMCKFPETLKATRPASAWASLIERTRLTFMVNAACGVG